MPKILVLLVLILASLTGCTRAPNGSNEQLEITKLRDVTSSAVAQVVLDPSLGLVTKIPGITDNNMSVGTSLTQPTTDGPGHQQGVINAVKRAKTRGAHFNTALCSGRYIFINGSVAIPSSQFASAWPAGIRVAEGPIVTYKAPLTVLGKTQQIFVSITVGGGTWLATSSLRKAPVSTNCSKAIASLLE